ncbi:hypothetical protein J6590_077575 [Homalodisca vitripennis]|nr:hypothetical protein J6590_077575 [Homalodisca vitripennis]
MLDAEPKLAKASALSFPETPHNQECNKHSYCSFWQENDLITIPDEDRVEHKSLALNAPCQQRTQGTHLDHSPSDNVQESEVESLEQILETRRKTPVIANQTAPSDTVLQPIIICTVQVSLSGKTPLLHISVAEYKDIATEGFQGVQSPQI